MAIAVEPEELPPIDERLALPEAGYEIIDGVVTFVVPADPPHAERHHTISALIGAHADPAFKVAIDMLTRTSKIDDIAPDVSVFPRGPDPITGGRQLEQLAFEIVSTESMSHATKKAAKLAGRGVRRVFAVDIARRRICEWAHDRRSWRALEPGSRIADPALAVSLSVDALLETVDTDDEVVRAHVARHHPVIEEIRAAGQRVGREQGRREGRQEGREEGRAEGRAEGREEGVATGTAQAIVRILVARDLELTPYQRAQILAERDPARLAGWVEAALRCATVEELLRDA